MNGRDVLVHVLLFAMFAVLPTLLVVAVLVGSKRYNRPAVESTDETFDRNFKAITKRMPEVARSMRSIAACHPTTRGDVR